MEKRIIDVPKEIRYISEWIDFPLQQLSTGHCIVNKTITGCGYTHHSLTNNIPTILCSPRKFLLENKYEQLCKDFSIFLVINESERGLDVDSEEYQTLSKKNIKELEEQETINQSCDKTGEDYLSIQALEENLRTYLFQSQLKSIVPKILVTYDSLKHVLSVLGETIKYYSVIVDEFQNIFMDSRFKADTELNFLSYIQSCPNVTYLSATPYIEEYLNELDEFKLLPYYELKWHPDRLQTIKVDMRKTFRPSQDIDRIIQDYLNGRFLEKINEETGEVCQSREVVFYTNSVKMISSAITRNNLKPDQVNIICSDTDKNKKALKRIMMNIGSAPLKGEPHKMFTFCTRTTYAGADFYSTNALSVIVSDCNIDSLATDIRMDFPQIMGRQRLKENVFRDECIFIYKLSDDNVTMNDYEELAKKKLKSSSVDLQNFQAVLNTYNSGDENLKKMISDFRLRIKVKKYNDDYTGIDEFTGHPKINKLVMISEKRAFELRCNIYKSDVQIYNEFANTSLEISEEDFIEKNIELGKLRDIYRLPGSFESKMRSICDFLLSSRWFNRIHISELYWLPLSQRNYLLLLGPERIKALGCKELSIKKELNNIEKSTNSCLRSLILDAFIVGNKYTLKEVKDSLGLIYSQLGLFKTAKASDLEEIFNLKRCTIYLSGAKLNGYEILGIKE